MLAPSDAARSNGAPDENAVRSATMYVTPAGARRRASSSRDGERSTPTARIS